MYKLKPNEPPFAAVDGAFAGREFTHDKTYAAIPPDETRKFLIVEEDRSRFEVQVPTLNTGHETLNENENEDGGES